MSTTFSNPHQEPHLVPDPSSAANPLPAPISINLAPPIPIPSEVLDIMAPGATETTPLLPSAQIVPKDVNGEEGGKFNPSLDPDWNSLKELKVLMRFGLPILGTHFLEFSLWTVTVFSLGHLGTMQLAAANLASFTCNVTCFVTIMGFCGALDTLCTQAYTSSNPKLTSLHALRMGVIIVILLVPMEIFLWNGRYILTALRQDPEVIRLASGYLKVMSVGMPAFGGFEIMRRFLQAQGLMHVPTICVACVAPINVFLNWLLVWGPEPVRVGFHGAPLATGISMYSLFTVSLLYTVFKAPRTAIGRWSLKEILDTEGLWISFKMGLAGAAMLASDWWSWEIVTLMASYLGPVALASQSVIVTSAAILFQVPMALGAASSVRIGNLLGWYLPDHATRTSRIALSLTGVVLVITSGVMWIFRNKWGYMFTSEEEVIRVVGMVLPLVSISQLADGMNGCAGGILRGAGLQNVGSLINLSSCWLIGLPLGYALTFRMNLGLPGLWWGLIVSLTYAGTFSCIWVLCINWTREADKGKERLKVGVVTSGDQDEEDDGSKSARGESV